MKFESRYILILEFGDNPNARIKVASAKTWRSKWATLARGLAAEALMERIRMLQEQDLPSTVVTLAAYWTELRQDQGEWHSQELPEELVELGG